MVTHKQILLIKMMLITLLILMGAYPVKPSDQQSASEFYFDGSGANQDPRLLVVTESSDGILTVSSVSPGYSGGTNDETYQIGWQKPDRSWASVIFGVDEQLADVERARQGAMKVLSGLSPETTALQFVVRNLGSDSVRLQIKLQNQTYANILPSMGIQLVHSITVDSPDWYVQCIPLNQFMLDDWIAADPDVAAVDATLAEMRKCVGTSGSESEEEAAEPTLTPDPACENWQEKYALNHFDWADIKQINFDPHYDDVQGILQIDEIRFVSASNCPQ